MIADLFDSVKLILVKYLAPNHQRTDYRPVITKVQSLI